MDEVKEPQTPYPVRTVTIVMNNDGSVGYNTNTSYVDALALVEWAGLAIRTSLTSQLNPPAVVHSKTVTPDGTILEN